jgi:23S rRNA pseudouridine2605 synthase
MSEEQTANPGQRLAKVMARAGLCSRREAETWIEAGRVTVNGQLQTSPAFNVTEADKVAVDGKPLPEAEPPRLFRFHKPAGYVVSASDELGRDTVFDLLPEKLPRLQAVGRLDINTEGLLLLTNDGELKRRLELPSTAWLRRYRVRAYGRIEQATLDRLKEGITVEGVNYGPIEATLDRGDGANAWMTLGLREGKNREIRKVLEHLGLRVNRLIRVSYGPFLLGELPKRGLLEVPKSQMRDQLGIGPQVKDRTGFAKAKPKPVKPGRRKVRSQGAPNADRRRKP